jgi:hypothetical protein
MGRAQVPLFAQKAREKWGTPPDRNYNGVQKFNAGLEE